MVTIRNKILASYLILLILMVINGYLSLEKIARITEHMDDLSNHLSIRLIHSKDIDYHAALVRGYAGAYAWSQSTVNQNAFNHHMQQLEASISALATTTTSPDERAGIERIRAATATYHRAFMALVSLVDERETLTYGVMNESKFNIETKLKAIKIAVSHQNHLQAFYAFDNAQDAFMQMLRYTSEYAAKGDERFSVLYEKAYQNAVTAFQNLEKSFQDNATQSHVFSAKASIDAYHDGFTRFRRAYRKQISLLREMFESHEPIITHAVTQMVRGIEGQYENHHQNAEKILSNTKKRLLGFMVAAVIVGLVIGQALSVMTKNMEQAQNEISRYQNQLEGLVEQRTADLEENRRLLLTLMSNLPGMAYRCRNDRNWTMEFISEGSHDLTGYPPESLIGNLEIAYADIIHPDDRTQVWDDVQKGLSKASPFVTIYRIITKKDEMKWVWEKGRGIFSEENTLLAIEGFISDITEQKVLEQEQKALQSQLAQAQKMESVGRLAGGVAHDFNNMLSVIQGNTEMILVDVEPKSPFIHHLEQIQKAAERSSDLTRQLLAFARKQPIAPKLLDLDEVIQSMITMLRRLIGEDIDLVWRPKSGLWSVKMDPSQIDQILANLCINARDAIKGVGKVVIESDNIVLDSAYCDLHEGFTPGNYVMVAVSDTGHGMSSDLQKNIFEPFFTTKEIGEGTGLGLATVYGIVKQNDGFINVYSELEKGSTFRIYLPAHTETAEKIFQNYPQHIPRPKGTETILLVEDEEAMLSMTTTMIEREGYTVIQAENPLMAIELAVSHSGKIDLLLTDVIMPEMNGRELSERLLGQFSHLKCLFMSGYTADVIAHHGVLSKETHFIQKPFSMVGLTSKIREVLDA